METKTRYCLGFASSPARDGVLLIRKNHPEWQRDKLNGIGGKLIGDEPAVQGMVREFEEETGVRTRQSDWKAFCVLTGPAFEVICFWTVSKTAIMEARNTTAETVERWWLPNPNLEREALSNVPWLIAMAADPDAPRMMAVVTYEPQH